MDCRDDLAAIYRDYWDLVYKRCYATLQDHEAALDATQDVFVQALHSFEDIQHDVVRGLVDLARTISYERKRRPTREVSLAEPPRSHGRVDDPAEIAERHRVLDDVWSALSPVERRYVADKFAGFSFEEIARRNRRALGTVSSNLARAREHARKVGEPLLPGAIGLAVWRRLTGASRRVRNLAHNSSVAAAAQPVGSMTVSLTLASLIAGAVPVATMVQGHMLPASQAPLAATLDQLTLNATQAGAAVAQPAFVAAPAPQQPASHAGDSGLLPPLLHSSSASTETPEDTQIITATPSPNYSRDRTIVALGHGAACDCVVLLMTTDGGATWQATAGPPAGNQIALPPAFPQDPAIYVGYTQHSGTVGDYRSARFGDGWQLLTGAPAGTLAFPAGFDRGDNRLVVSNSGGVWSYDVVSGLVQPMIVEPNGVQPALAMPTGTSNLGILVLSTSQAVAAGGTTDPTALTGGETVWACPPGRPCSRTANVALIPGAQLVASPAFQSDGTLLAYQGASLLASSDAGGSFHSVSLPSTAVNAWSALLSSSPAGPAIWATVSTGSGWELISKPSLDAPWRETDGGDQAITHQGGRLLVVGAQRLLFLLAQGGMRCSVNGGVTWEARCPAA